MPVIYESMNEYTCRVFCMFEMCPSHKWPGDIDLRKKFFRKIRKIKIDGHGPKKIKSFLRNSKINKHVYNNIDLSRYRLVILDDNLCKSPWGFQSIYKACHKFKIPVIGTPHGNRELDEKFIIKNMCSAYDKTFVFGSKDRDIHKKHASSLIP